MPELPDIEAYLAALRPLVLDAVLTDVRIHGFSLLKTYDPPVEAAVGRRVEGLRRLGKRIVIGLHEPEGNEDEDPVFLVIHLMIAGRLRWQAPGGRSPGRGGLASFSFSRPHDPTTPGGVLVLTEAGTTRRASLHVVRGTSSLSEHDRGGKEPLEVDVEGFAEELRRENRTVKRALTDPRRFSGIGNAYSDEILHAARISPVRRTQQLDEDELLRLYEATRSVLGRWVQELTEEAVRSFPTRVTAFRDGFAVHGRYGEPCPRCATTVRRIRYASNETDYCPRCQTEGKLLADRALSRLLKDDWPRSVDELEGA